MTERDPFQCRTTLKIADRTATIYSLPRLERDGLTRLSRLPYSIRVLLENVLRHAGGEFVTTEQVRALAGWTPETAGKTEIPFLPARVVLQDFTGVPCVVDLAAMRDAMADLQSDPARINPVVPCDLVIDHSVQVDHYGTADAFRLNVALEFERNVERYQLLKFAQRAFRDFRVVPPGTGIVHQVNLEYLSPCVQLRPENGELTAFPDTLVGTDSHTTMINGLGVLGWGVGGIEAEAVMLGQPYFMLMPQVVGMRLVGKLAPGCTATDLVLTVTERLRERGVVDKFVEFYGPGLHHLPVADRATIANMSPEYGATCGFFPVDRETLTYLERTGRDRDQIALVEAYCRAQQLWHEPDAPAPVFSDHLELDLGTVVPSVAGPKRPQDLVPLTDLRRSFAFALPGLMQPTVPAERREAGAGGDRTLEQRGRRGAGHRPPSGDAVFVRNRRRGPRAARWLGGDRRDHLVHQHVQSLGDDRRGAAGAECGRQGPSRPPLGQDVAGPRVARGHRLPRSRRTLGRPERAGFPDRRIWLHHLHRQQRTAAGAGRGGDRGTCAGHAPRYSRATATSRRGSIRRYAPTISCRRCWWWRLPCWGGSTSTSPGTHSASAPMASRCSSQTSGPPRRKSPTRWPSAVHADMFRHQYRSVFDGDDEWRALKVPEGSRFAWDPASTYVRLPPFFTGLAPKPAPLTDVRQARVLALLGDSVTTDHISPAGAIPKNGPAAAYLREHGVAQPDWNTFGARRGNHEVMMRGTFGNVRIKNQLVPDKEGNWTMHFPSGEVMSIYDAAMKYAATGTPLVLLVGKEYGTGSSRDWAAKGTALLGVRAVIAESYERIHRSNLVGMGVLPLAFEPGKNAAALGLTGREVFDIAGIAKGLEPGGTVTITATDPDSGKMTEFRRWCGSIRRWSSSTWRMAGSCRGWCG